MITHLFSAEDLDEILAEPDDCKIRIVEDAVSYPAKPGKGEIPRIVKRLRATTDTVHGIARKAAHGRSFRPGILVGGTTADCWKCQQSFFVDIEHSYTVSQSLKICERVGIIPNIIYPTFNFSPTNQRYRMVFLAPEPIYDPNVRDEIQKTLIALFHGDEKTFDKARLFFGGNFCLWVDKQARLDIPKLLSLRKEGGLYVA